MKYCYVILFLFPVIVYIYGQDLDVDQDTGKVSLDYYQKLESDSIRMSWIEQGGILKQYGMTGNYIYASMGMSSLGSAEDSDSDSEFTMHGIGLTYTGALKFLSPPDYSEGKNLWNAFSIGISGGGNVTYGSMTIPYVDYITVETYDTEMTITSTTMELSGNIGYTFGLGKFFGPEDWKGIMLALYWKPGFTMMTNTTEIEGKYYKGDPQSAFNMKGIMWTLDWGDFGGLSSELAQESHFSAGGYFLPETDKTPLLISIGIGVVWY